ncbi:MAG TPA: type VI secretion system baseplate subunit TssF [Gemmatimonadaceae bacterium]|nr:type VI secretion system baseplate subunit TssF [Gemmatimonadaceae bacterium]
MRDDLLYYYERELTFLRRMGAQFAERYPKVASRLQLEPSKCEDPHVERLLEAFAFLAARVHLKVDDDFPEISEALLDVIYPQYVRPIPSLSLVEFQLDPEQGKLTTGLRIPRGAQLYSRPVGGVPCKFRTCYDTTLWPLTVAAVQWLPPDRLNPPVRARDAVAALRLELRCLPDVRFDALELSTLRLHLSGENTLSHTLYEVLCNNCMEILVREVPASGSRAPIALPSSALQPVGFAADEALLPFPRRTFAAHRLLQEYFTFPDKFLFLDLAAFDAVRESGFGEAVEVIFLIAPFERNDRRHMVEAGLSTHSIRLGCTPVVNLFAQTSEPILVTQKRYEYELVPDARRRLTTETYSVDEVVGITPGDPEPLRFEPLYSYRHGAGRSGAPVFWGAQRRPSGWRSDGGTSIFLSFVDLSHRLASPRADAITARLTCFNGDLPGRLPFGDPLGDFELQGGGPLRAIVALVKPTAVIQPPLGKPQLWRLISQLSLNYLSIVEDGVEALQEILRLHNAASTTAGEKQIQGVLRVQSSPAFARVATEQGVSFARGRRVDLELDEEQFAGGGAYLFASVLEHFLGMYASMNSFTALAVRTTQRKEELREWPPRAGSTVLL